MVPNDTLVVRHWFQNLTALLDFWSPGGDFINADAWSYPRSWICFQGLIWASDFEKLPQVILKCSKVCELLR